MAKSRKRTEDALVGNNLVLSAESVWLWERSLEFVIEGSRAVSGLKVKVTEIDDGQLHFDLSLLEGSAPRPDIQAIFFNLAEGVELTSISAEGDKVSAVDVDNQIDTGYGLNVRGQQQRFDVGVGLSPRGKDGLNTIEAAFILSSNSDTPLSLDDLGGMEFGVRVNAIGTMPVFTGTAPYAPDAVDDTESIFEDGALDLNEASALPTGVLFIPLGNDSDGDHDTLTIVDVRGASHGTVEIIDGDDADNKPGDALLYTPDLDFSGFDSFEYLISDGNGGQDFASVDVEVAAVADSPDLSVEVLKTGRADQMVLKVLTNQTDVDASEFIDRIELSATDIYGNALSNLSAYLNEVIYNPDSEDGSLSYDFLIDLPSQANSLFDLHVRSFSKEKSNGDEEFSTHTVRVETVAATNNFSKDFIANDQNIWSSGDAARLQKGFNLDVDQSLNPGTAGWSINGHGHSFNFSYAGFGGRTDFTTAFTAENLELNFNIQNTFTLSGGTIDANINYEGSVNTLYNKTVDQLQFSTSAAANMSKSSFSSVSPHIQFESKLTELAFKGDFGAKAWGYVTGNVANTSIGTAHFTFVDGSIPINLDATSLLSQLPGGGLSLTRFDGEALHFMNGLHTVRDYTGVKKDALQNELVEYKFESPYFTTVNEQYDENADTITGNNYDPFLTLTYDLDGIASHIKKIVNPVSKSWETKLFDLLTVKASADLIDIDLVNPFSFALEHEIEAKEIEAYILFTEHADLTAATARTEDFILGQNIVIDNASFHDVNGDGHIEYDIFMTAQNMLETKAGMNIGFQDQVDVLKASATFPVWGTESIGPAYEADGNVIDTGKTVNFWSDQFVLNMGVTSFDGWIA